MYVNRPTSSILQHYYQLIDSCVTDSWAVLYVAVATVAFFASCLMSVVVHPSSFITFELITRK